MIPRNPLAIGPAASGLVRSQLWDLYCRKAYVLDNMDLAGLSMTLFDVAIGSSYLPVGGIAGTTPQLTVGNSDTNLDTPGQIPFDYMLIHGLSLQPINTQMGSGETADDDYIEDYALVAGSILQEAYVTLKVDETEISRLIFQDAPGAGQFSSGPGDASSNGVAFVSNGLPLVSNYLDYSSEGPIALKKSSRLKVTIQFGPNFLNFTGAYNKYFPDSTASQNTYLRAVLKAYRAVPAQ